MNRGIEIKCPNEFKEFKEVDGLLIVVLGWVLNFCQMREVRCIVTNIHQKFPESVSMTHPDGRAFDLSIHEWSEEEIDECMFYVNENAGDLGAYSASDSKQRVVIRHDLGLGDHLHFQVRR